MFDRANVLKGIPLAAIGCAVAALFSATGAAAQQAPETEGLQARRVVIDAATGRARAPEAGEWKSTAPAAGARSALKAKATDGTGLESHPAMKRILATPSVATMGAVGQRFSARNLAFTVARRDGNSVSTECVTGEDAAHGALQAAVKGERNDR